MGGSRLARSLVTILGRNFMWLQSQGYVQELLACCSFLNARVHESFEPDPKPRVRAHMVGRGVTNAISDYSQLTATRSIRTGR